MRPDAAAGPAFDNGLRVRRNRLTTLLGHSRSVARELLVVTVFGLTYAGVRELTEGSAARAVQNGERVSRLERHLGLAWEHAFQAAVLGRRVVVDLANWMYIWGHWPVIAIVAITLFSARRERYHLLRNAVIISGLLGFLFFALFPTAPPRLVDAGLVDTVTRWSDSYRTLQPPRFTNQYAAMPSLHFGWNLLVGAVLFGTTRSLVVRSFAVLMPAAMGFAVIATANHWTLDVFVGAGVVAIGFGLAKALEGRQRFATPATQPESPLLYWQRSGNQSRIAVRREVSRRPPRGESPRPLAPSRGTGGRTRRGRRQAVSRSR